MSVALAWVPCCKCSAPCVSTPARWQLALCQYCRPAPVIAPHAVPWRPTIARVAIGELAPVVPHDGRTAKERESAAKLAAERGRYRVLTPARPAERHEMPQAAVDARKEVMGAPGWRADRMTYAVAEDTERGELVRSVALVTLVGPWRGVAFWENGQWSVGMTVAPAHHRCTTVDEWITRARGEAWTPPSCPRCGRIVRLKLDGQPYIHNRIGTKEVCI